jgi:hypothetical protein
VNAVGNEFKLFIDTVLVPERLYGALNFNYALGAQRGLGPDEKWAENSGTNVSGALTYQITDKMFAGVEGRWSTAFSDAFLNDQAGWGLFAGPTLLLKLTDSAAFNVVWTSQVPGERSASAAISTSTTSSVTSSGQNSPPASKLHTQPDRLRRHHRRL